MKKNKNKEKKQAKVMILSSILLIVIILSWVLFLNLYKSEPKEVKDPLYNSTNIFFYYGFSCSHCQDIERYVLANRIEQKLSEKNISIIKKEIFKDTENKMEFDVLCEKCGISQDKRGVPMIYYLGKCYMGASEVMAILDTASK